MKSEKGHLLSRPDIVFVIFACDVLLLGISIFLYVSNQNLRDEIMARQALIDEALSQNDIMSSELAKTQSELKDRTNEVDMLSEQVGDITGVVGDLEKLSQIDEELLMKYSKVYFLNENYVPSRLDNISKRYLFNEAKPLLLHAEVIPKLEDMIDDAESDNIDLKVISAFRSFNTQESLKYNYKVTYGAGSANAFSADQGYSEHQLGTTVDLAAASNGNLTTSFENTAEYKWLLDNAHRYGFVLSYPPNNKFYMFEPWHWRYVGVKLAKDLHGDNKYFYDLDQREIDKYLLYLFD